MIGEVTALSAAICWAITIVLYKKILRNANYLVVNLVRTGFAALFLLAILPATQYQSPIRVNELTIIVIAAIITLVIGDTLLFIGLKKIGASRAHAISFSYPLYLMLLATVFLKESLTFALFIGTPLIVVGTTTVSLYKNEKNTTIPEGGSSLFGVISSLGSAVCYSFGIILYRLALSDGNVDPIVATFIISIAILPILLIAVVATGELNQVRQLTKNDIVLLAICGILELGLGGIFLLVSLTLINASRATPLVSTSPLFTLILASLFAREKITLKKFIGTILIVTGVIFVTLYTKH